MLYAFLPLTLNAQSFVFCVLNFKHTSKDDCPRAQERTHACFKYFEASHHRRGRNGCRILVYPRRFIEDKCIVGSCFMKRGGTLMHKHFPMVVKGNFSGVLMLNKKNKVCLGWDESPPTSHVVSCKRLRDDLGWTLHW